ncbi:MULTISPECIES: glutathione S-transferase family protein [Ralstonia solanacearum species complex]|uniref:Glutathione s-transferase protein n=3 Tax=Ralstonia solanacearum TaxID=305 RepID=A0ABF7R935_RALSL|nr:glutathione S-transferase [Ralstonia solanacearum]ALF89433.1 putative GST-like protein YibF [Ralstonia solanacearum]ATI28818.1 glutathione S-transferase [Ralstonia solanacearum]EAP74493.1 Glutathione S-transferase [Ralstonia solanacearum UW551]KEI34228.1 glutathione S-transferase [Ralstonia solanacearum]KFX27529.1 glutathione S-transferase [Ralstonia solanacearum]
MKLIGMLDSPYVRRTAISLKLLGLPFEHAPVSVFRHFDAFSAVNPVVKAPTLVCDDGTVLMDSTLILDYAEALAGRSLMPAALPARRQALRIVGLALAACEKSVQLVYEFNQRPAEKTHAPWVERVQGQLRAAVGALEAALHDAPAPVDPRVLAQPDLTTAVAWGFIQLTVPDRIAAADYPRLAAFAAAAERLDVFRETPIE